MRKILKCLAAVLLLAVSLQVLPSAALAQSSDTAAAAEHFEKGVALYRDGSLDAALVHFERAYELVPNYLLLYNIGQVNAERGEFVSAMQSFEQYLAEGSGQIEPERRSKVEAELRKLRTRVAQLMITTNVGGAELFVDGRLAGKSPLQEPILVNAGQRIVRVEKPGYVTVTQTLKIVGEEQPRLLVNLEPVEPVNLLAFRSSAGTEPETNHFGSRLPEPPEPKYSYTPFWISAGAAAVLGGAAATFGFLSNSANRDLDAEYDRFPTDRGAAQDLQQRVKTYAAVSDGTSAGALVAAAFAVYFLISPPERASEAPRVGWRSLQLRASAGGAAVGGAF